MASPATATLQPTRSPLAKANLVLKKPANALARLIRANIPAANGLGLAKGTVVVATAGCKQAVFRCDPAALTCITGI